MGEKTKDQEIEELQKRLEEKEKENAKLWETILNSPLLTRTSSSLMQFESGKTEKGGRENKEKEVNILERAVIKNGVPFYKKSDFIYLYTESSNNRGFGTVHKAYAKRGAWGITAVKTFSSNVEYTKREIQLLLKVSHPNIVKLYGLLHDENGTNAPIGHVMEYLKDGSLHDVIHNHSTDYDRELMKFWMGEIACGLQYLHSNGIIHRDIKPANILMGDTSKILKLTDFGLVRQISSNMRGTSEYLAPEVLDVNRHSSAADVYSFGVSVWEIIHRKHPWDYYSKKESFPIDQHKAGENLAAVMRSCLSNPPSKRPTIKEIMDLFHGKIGGIAIDLSQPAASSRVFNAVPIFSFNQCAGSLELVAEGSYSKVHKIFHKQLGWVAYKDFKGSIEYSAREVQILSECPKHRNLIEILAIIPDQDDSTIIVGYVMPFMEAGSLYDAIHDKNKKIDYTNLQGYFWIVQIAEGIEHLHKNEIIHRDLKTANILLRNNNEIIICDFGMARYHILGEKSTRIGTWPYLAPEVHEMTHYSYPLDVFAFAITCWEILHKELPYSEMKGVPDHQIINKIIQGLRPTFHPKIETDVANFITSCWDSEPKNRPTMSKCVTFFKAKINDLLHASLLAEEATYGRLEIFEYEPPKKRNPMQDKLL